MTSSAHLSTLEPWQYNATPFSNSWLSDTQTLTHALTQSLSNSGGSCSDLDPAPASSPSSVPARRTKIPAVAKPTKRRSRASKKTTTTFITADPANFRKMVQQVTGVRFSGGGGGFVPAVVKPEAVRVDNAGYCLPTLDTSAFVLDQSFFSQPPCSAPAAAEGGGGGGGGGFDFDAFSCFPTLESWKVM